MKGVFEQYPHWKTSEAHQREITKRFYKVLVETGIKNYIDIVKKIMRVLTGTTR